MDEVPAISVTDSQESQTPTQESQTPTQGPGRFRHP